VVLVEDDCETPPADYAKPGFELAATVAVDVRSGNRFSLPMESVLVNEDAP
jgi:hypothetical protein